MPATVESLIFKIILHFFSPMHQLTSSTNHRTVLIVQAVPQKKQDFFAVIIFPRWGGVNFFLSVSDFFAIA